MEVEKKARSKVTLLPKNMQKNTSGLIAPEDNPGSFLLFV